MKSRLVPLVPLVPISMEYATELQHPRKRRSHRSQGNWHRWITLPLCAGCVLLLVRALQGEPAAFVHPPSTRLHRTARGAEGDESAESLRARVAQLEMKLAEKLLTPDDVPEEERAPSVLQPLVDAAVKEVPELQAVEDARMGMTEDKMYVFQMGNASGKQAIYRRKYEVMGMVLTQQEEFLKASRKAVKSAKSSPAIKELMELKKNGGLGMTKKGIAKEISRIEANDNMAAIIFRDVIPKLEENPLGDALGYLSATFLLILVLALFSLCLVPPVINPDE